jgi:AraC-like DNA-binding protein
VHSALAADLERIRCATDDVDAAAGMVQRVLAAHVAARGVNPTVRAGTTAILRTQGQVSVETIAAHAGVSRRHLERAFLHGVGLSPKRLARITRFQRAVRVLEQADGPRPGTVTAAACGYADQSHFIREFQELAGCSPSAFMLRSAQLTGFFLSP